MKKSKKAFGFILCLFFFSVNLFSQFFSMEDMFPETVINELNTNKTIKIFRNSEKTRISEIAPATEFGKKSELLWNNEEDPLIKIEIIYAIDKIQNIDESKKIKTILQSVSKMQGMKYYSHRKNKIKVLYPQFFCVEKIASNPVRLEDKFIENINGKEILVFQEDNSFGKYFSKVVYHENESEYAFSYENITPIKVGFITGADEKNVKIYLLINQTEDKIIIYAKVEALVSKFPGIMGMMEDSLTSRAQAIAEWFIKQYHDVYEKQQE